MKSILILFLLSVFSMTYAQKKQKELSAVVEYHSFYNGKPNTEYGKTELTFHNNLAKVERVYPFELSEMLKRVTQYQVLDYNKNKTFTIADIQGKRFYSVSDQSPQGEIELTENDTTILGYQCDKIKFISFSNTIEVWYTKEAGIKGTPSYFIKDALVLKTVRNGSSVQMATSFKKLKSKETKDMQLMPDELGEELDVVNLRYKAQQGVVTTLNIFDDEQISWGNEIKNPEGDQDNLTYRFGGGTVILKKVTLPKHDVPCDVFLELEQMSNGDAYDRTGSVFMIRNTDKPSMLDAMKNGIKTVPKFTDNDGKEYHGMIPEGDFEPAIELMRFFTPFGVNKFNDKRVLDGLTWANNTYYKQSISYLEPILEGEVWIGVFIGNYDKGGHKVSLKMKYYPKENKPSAERKEYWVKPIFNTCNILEMASQNYPTMFGAGGLKVDISIPENVSDLHLHYITTGHGGWGGGDEFNPKENRILIDGQLAYSYTPWRCDCGTYRELNPASGNFWNGESSSDLDRSGWCPGTVTNPVQTPLNISSGTHQFEVQIPQGEPAGGYSFSSWCVSGVLIGEVK
ncbi:DUF4412 domain-containing protein [Flammeovirga yaeyamensis]|uniref:DUF4412 domain-containing protein n=1 Tax=Flammeovirga yaeyamensis TaxID=367791 RepID=A0AAX1N530_9BACT|nr:PNGase F N-terminal domain-containing protein [Flammeovirga yaeyamensis]MBB3701258.1 hypothetical protein [Flammeovirga yaeyamensis]NMF38272.1 DUF4412 domain-containing protein [Flammeovirga yaeyamensis]QWG02683.1 DUF4412 domain-containing protein [Flammeovirga yaeyamensis]